MKMLLSEKQIGAMWDHEVRVLDTASVLAFARRLEAEALENAARICDELGDIARDGAYSSGWFDGCDKCSDVIRASGESCTNTPS